MRRPFPARLSTATVAAFVAATVAMSTVLVASNARAEAETAYMTEDEAVAAVLDDADRYERVVLDSTRSLRASIETGMGRAKATVWEPSYPVIAGYDGSRLIGHAVVVEEIGKHRNITFAVGVSAEGAVTGVALMVYREAYGGEVRSRRFLTQYKGKTGAEHLLPGRDIRNITGATLSVQAIGRGVKKATIIAAQAREAANRATLQQATGPTSSTVVAAAPSPGDAPDSIGAASPDSGFTSAAPASSGAVAP